jgi:hypothetical protein
MLDPHASVSDRLHAPRLIAAVGRDRKRRRQIATRLLEVAYAIEEGQRVKVDAKRMSPSLRMDGLARRR